MKNRISNGSHTGTRIIIAKLKKNVLRSVMLNWGKVLKNFKTS